VDIKPTEEKDYPLKIFKRLCKRCKEVFFIMRNDRQFFCNRCEMEKSMINPHKD